MLPAGCIFWDRAGTGRRDMIDIQAKRGGGYILKYNGEAEYIFSGRAGVGPFIIGSTLESYLH